MLIFLIQRYSFFNVISKVWQVMQKKCGVSQKRVSQDSTLKYSLRHSTFSDGPRMTPYHKKFRVRSCEMWCEMKETAISTTTLISCQKS